MRELMNREISALRLAGMGLDVGGGKHASYNGMLNGTFDLMSVNIDPAIEPSVVVDLSQRLPFTDDSFDFVLSFNTLEHLWNDQLALAEIVRVTRPGGRIHVLVPFLYRVHGHPHDYHRHTAEGWNKMLIEAGIASSGQRIKPIVWDPMSTAWALVDTAPLGRNWWRLRRFLRPLVLGRPLVMKPIDRREIGRRTSIISEYALAYAIQAIKPNDEV